PVYLAKAEIEIHAPEYDQALSALVSHDVGRRDPANEDRYVPNRAAQLRSKWLAERVVTDPSIAPHVGQYEDPAVELFRTLSVVPFQKGGNSFLVTLEGKDPARTTRLLDTLLRKFQERAKDEIDERLQQTMFHAENNLKELKEGLDRLDEE